jgi:hypothetical protein
MRATAVSAFVLSVCALAATPAIADTTAYASDNGGGPATPNSIVLPPIPVTASVGSVCTVISGGSPPAGGDFGATVALGDITDGNGHLTSAIRSASDAFAAAGQAASFQVNCNGSANAVSIKATPLSTGSAAPASGYVTSVNYTADAVYAVTGGPGTVTQSTTSDGAVHNATFAAGVKLANTAGDIVIKAHDFTTAAPASDILVASSAYAATITVTIGPGT